MDQAQTKAALQAAINTWRQQGLGFLAVVHGQPAVLAAVKAMDKADLNRGPIHYLAVVEQALNADAAKAVEGARV